MSKSIMVCQDRKLDLDPSLEQIPNGRYGVVVDGTNLPSDTTEDVRGISLCPSYSAKKIRRIKQLAKKNSDHENKYSSSLQRRNKNFRTQRCIKPSVCDLLMTGQARGKSEVIGKGCVREAKGLINQVTTELRQDERIAAPIKLEVRES
jgi:hypothetical protein